MSMIKISQLTFAYPGTHVSIFERVNLILDSDWKLGFTGRNGRGKTTFLKLLMGAYPYEGHIQAKVSFGYYPIAIQSPERLTIHVIEGEVATETWRILKEMNLLDLDENCLYRPFDSLSQGEQTKFQMLILFLKENPFLLIDEPTNHLDDEGRRVMMRYLNRKKGFIVVSHDRAFLDGCTDHTLSINKTSIEIQQGSYSSYLKNKNSKDGFELAENEKLEKQIKALTLAANRAKGWSDAVEASKFGGGCSDRGFVGAKSAKMMKRSKVIQRRAERSAIEKEMLLKDVEIIEAIEIKPEPFRQELLMRVTNLSLAYGEKLVVKGLNFEVNAGDRIAIRGANGAGKSSVLKALLKAIAYKGHVAYPNDLQISYVSQGTGHLKGSLNKYLRDSTVEEWLFRSMLHKLGFWDELFEQGLEQLSEGQKKKILLAESLCQRAHVYIWDEPLNFIDIHSREQIETALLTFKPTLIFVEHDERFSSQIANKVIDL